MAKIKIPATGLKKSDFERKFFVSPNEILYLNRRWQAVTEEVNGASGSDYAAGGIVVPDLIKH